MTFGRDCHAPHRMNPNDFELIHIRISCLLHWKTVYLITKKCTRSFLRVFSKKLKNIGEKKHQYHVKSGEVQASFSGFTPPPLPLSPVASPPFSLLFSLPSPLYLTTSSSPLPPYRSSLSLNSVTPSLFTRDNVGRSAYMMSASDKLQLVIHLFV